MNHLQDTVDSLIYQPKKLRGNQIINHWLINGIYTRDVMFVPTTMEGDINSWLIEGFSIHENPCRRQFVEERRSNPPQIFREGQEFPLPGDIHQVGKDTNSWQVYFPWDNPRVEQSGFWFVPTHLLSYAATQIVFSKKHKTQLRIKTCGGVTLWLNGKMVTDFTPFTRNVEGSVVIEVEFKEGINKLLVCWEDLAERDTMYTFAVEYLGEEQLEIHLPLPDGFGETIRRTENALGLAHFPTDVFKGEEVRLLLPQPFDFNIEANLIYGNFFDGTEQKRITIPAGEKELFLGHTDEFGHHYIFFTLNMDVSGVNMSKKFGCQSYDTSYDMAAAEADNLQSRKELALRCIAEKGAHNIHTAVAILKTGGDFQEVERLLLEGIEGIEQRKDCSDFYCVGLFRLWRDERNSGLFTEAFWERVKSCILGYRYWIDEPGDDVMWFFSENHALLFHTCELLAGQLFGGELFSNSGESGDVHKAKAEKRLIQWFDRFFEEGLAEWNSNAYIPIDAVGLLHIYEFAENVHLREQAKKAMDLLFYYITVNAHQGILSTSFGRSYEKELLGHYAAGTTSMCWIGYGVGNVNNYSISNVAFCLSDYAPPASYSAYLQLDKGLSLKYLNEQGTGGYAKLYNYRTKDYSVSSINRFRPGHRGYQEHVTHLSLSPEAQLWVNHPAEIHKHGDGRPCFWAGNGTLPDVVQHESLSLVLFDLPEEQDADWTHAYFPTFAFTQWTHKDNWYFAKFNEGYAAVYAANGLEMEKFGVTKDRELISSGRRNFWLMRAGNAQEFGTFAHFVERVSAIEPNFESDTLSVAFTDPAYGKINWGWKEAFEIEGNEVIHGGFGVNGKLELTK